MAHFYRVPKLGLNWQPLGYQSRAHQLSFRSATQVMKCKFVDTIVSEYFSNENEVFVNSR